MHFFYHFFFLKCVPKRNLECFSLTEVHSGGDFITAITVLFKNSFSESSIQFHGQKLMRKKYRMNEFTFICCCHYHINERLIHNFNKTAEGSRKKWTSTHSFYIIEKLNSPTIIKRNETFPRECTSLYSWKDFTLWRMLLCFLSRCVLFFIFFIGAVIPMASSAIYSVEYIN